ncbi:ABC transporter permease [Fodinicurvata sp. EGI_FJ10296]|uniref:ABC transporter permease n=1 Tax=Fodinicurvata sp. EGI_FJ10296 TaxID=3231908 RepID=UPI0034570BFC
MTSRHTAIPDRPPWTVGDFLLRWEVMLIGLLAVVVTANSLISPYFLNMYSLADSTFNFSEKAIIALSMALVIICRDIDLSVAAIIALASTAMGLAAEAGAGVPMLAVIGIVVGIIAGGVNGAIVTRFAVPAIVVTIGTMSLYRGISYIVLGDTSLSEYPADFWVLGQGYAFGLIPYEFIIFLVLAAIMAFVLHGTVIGRNIYAIGNNPTAAQFSGIPVDRYRFCLFTLNGAFAGLSAVLLTSRIGSTRPNIALGWELEVVTVVVLGGVSILGGSGTIPGVVLAVLVLGMFTFGLGLINVPGIVMSIFIGLLLIGAIALPILLRRAMERLRSHS